jgi:hypothetical protein
MQAKMHYSMTRRTGGRASKAHTINNQSFGLIVYPGGI